MVYSCLQWFSYGHTSNYFMFVVLKHVYIPLLFFSGVDYIDAPTPYMMGLHSSVDTSDLAMDGVSFFFPLNLLWSSLVCFYNYVSCLVLFIMPCCCCCSFILFFFSMEFGSIFSASSFGSGTALLSRMLWKCYAMVWFLVLLSRTHSINWSNFLIF
jgi:hypothetical protein